MTTTALLHLDRSKVIPPMAVAELEPPNSQGERIGCKRKKLKEREGWVEDKNTCIKKDGWMDGWRRRKRLTERDGQMEEGKMHSEVLKRELIAMES